MIGAHLRDVTGQSYSIHACTRANHARYSPVRYILRLLETKFLEVILRKKLNSLKVSSI